MRGTNQPFSTCFSHFLTAPSEIPSSSAMRTLEYPPFFNSKAFFLTSVLSEAFSCFRWSDSRPKSTNWKELKFDSFPIRQSMTSSEGQWKAPYLTLICLRYLREASCWLSPTAKQESTKLIKLLLPWISFRLMGAKRFRLGVWAIRSIDQPCIFFRLLSLIKNGVVLLAFS